MSKWIFFNKRLLQFARRQIWFLKLIYHTLRDEFLDRVSPKMKKANYLHWLSMKKQYEGEFEEAIQLQIESAEIYRACGSIDRTLSAYYDLCDMYDEFGRQEEALEVCQKAISFLEKRSPDSILALGFYNIGLMFGSLDLNTKSIEYLQLGRKICEDSGIEDQASWFDQSIAEQLRQLGKYDEAINLLFCAAEVAKKYRDNELLAECYGLLSRIYSDKDDADKAEEFHQMEKEALAQNERQNPGSNDRPAEDLLDDLENMSPLQKARHFNSLGFESEYFEKNEEKGLNYFYKSVSVLERIRSNFSRTDWRASFFEKTGFDSYTRIISIFLGQRDYWKALGYIEQLKSRVLIEMIANRMNQNLQISISDGAPAFSTMEEFAKKYSSLHLEKTAIIFLFPYYGITYLRVLHNEGDTKELSLSCEMSEYSLETASAHIQCLDQMIKNSNFQGLHSFLDDILEGMYAELFSPLVPHIPPEIKRIVFVPYSVFHLLPLHAMFTEEKGEREYLIDRYIVTYAPSIKILNYCRSLRRSLNGNKFVGSADTKGDLHFSPYEAKAIADFFETKVNKQTNRIDMIKKTRDSHVLHYAGHAEDKGLHLHSNGDSSIGEVYEVQDIFASLRLPEAWLVTLSACETGRVKIGETDEYIGIPSAFLHAGAATVISSLWCVPERSTTLLMCKMYEFINEGFGKSDSIRRAQLWLRNSTKQQQLEALEKYVPWTASIPVGAHDITRFGRKPFTREDLLPQDIRKPYYWAGFICTGAP